MNKQTCDDIDENTTSEDEVTFLLRLRPSPPPRQRRHSLDYKSRTAGKRLCVSPTGWDISLEHKEQDPGRNKGRPPQSPTQCRRLSLTEGKDNAQRNSPKRPLRKFPNFGMRRKKEETTPHSSLNWEVIVEKQECRSKSPSPPPVPPRIQPSAPPQEFPENWYHPPKPVYYAPPLPQQLYQHQQDDLVPTYRYCLNDQDGFNNENSLHDKSPMLDPLNLPGNNCQVVAGLEMSCYNTSVLSDSTLSPRSSLQNFAAFRQDRRNSIVSGGNIDLISSYAISPPLPSPGFHVNTAAIVQGLIPQKLPQMSSNAATKPPLPSPRDSLKTANFINGYDYGTLSKAKSELSLNVVPQEQDERYRKLQSERDNLQLQVQVLSEQIEAQTDKIADLEKSLSEKKQQLINTEDMLQREMLSRSSLETQKLELMSAMSELKLQHAELERELVHLRSSQFNNNSSFDSTKKSQYLPRISPQPHHTSTPVHHLSSQNIRVSPSPSPLSGSLSASPRKIDSSSMQQDVQPPKTPPATYRRQIDLQYSSLPRQQFLSNGGTLGVVDSNANPADGARKGVAFAETEKIVIEDVNDTSQSPSLQFNKNKGIKKIFGKLKRSGSGNLDDLPGIGEFQRGGVRATAAGRLGCNEQSQKPNKPFEEWDIDDVCNWLQDLNLDQYTTEAKRWGKTGKELHETSINEIEKELGIKNPLHRKKLQLALVDVQENGSSDPYLSKAGKLDMAWVLRWLDDTGLPQYKESFLMNKIDGRVLHRLTMDDLGLLHITSLLHVASLKRGIQVLRENNYEAGCLQRRSLPEDPTQPTPKQISLWTTHRVMEWLKAVDLAEYAPNLRGSGVHGGLMVLENKFTAELLASLLSIPPGKTLLRRHLNTHFKELLGKDIIQAKREAEGTLGYIPLTPSSKIKVTKKSHFSLKRNKSKSEADYGDLVCPINALSGEQNGSTLNSSLGMMMKEDQKEEVVSLRAEEIIDSSTPSSSNSPVPDRRTV